jgi:hypothetical protein
MKGKSMIELAKKNMEELGKTLGYSYDSMMSIAEKAAFNGTFCFGDDDEPDKFYQVKDEFFGLYNRITGRNVDPEEIYFRCAC